MSEGHSTDADWRGGRHWTYGPGVAPGADRPGRWPEPDDSDRWFSDGHDRAHTEHLEWIADGSDRVDSGADKDGDSTAAAVESAHRAVQEIPRLPDSAVHRAPDGRLVYGCCVPPGSVRVRDELDGAAASARDHVDPPESFDRDDVATEHGDAR